MALAAIQRPVAYAELELSLNRWLPDSYAPELRYSPPDSDADVRLIRDTAPVRFDLGELRKVELDTEAYGKLLGQHLFADRSLYEAFRQAYNNALASAVPLRMRLFITPGATELHSLHWETLRDPDDGTELLNNERIYFSRYLSSQDFLPVRLRARGNLRALVVVANPTDLDQWEVGSQKLARVEASDEQRRAQKALGNVPATVLASGGEATLNKIVEHLRDGYDILYLLCHGFFGEGQPWLLLEDNTGKAARVAGNALVTEISKLLVRPRLVVLLSCQSAVAGGGARSQDNGALSALGPRLAEMGIPAVLGMQGSVTVETATAFISAFFEYLQQDGQIDRAIGLARWAVRDRLDAWMPVLFMRLKSGRIWYVPGIVQDEADLSDEKWDSLLMAIGSKTCTPILGPGLTDAVIASRQEIARSWAVEKGFPMAPYEWDDLPQVAQFLAVSRAGAFVRQGFVQYVRQKIQQRYKNDLPESLRVEDTSAEALIGIIGPKLRASDPLEPHSILASLSVPVYITANPDDLLVDALRAVGRKPRIDVCRWNWTLAKRPKLSEQDPNYIPSAQEPLVYYLFGRLDDFQSLVLTQDDYFEYLTGITANLDWVPSAVLSAFNDTTLMFLGFQMEDWDFRVLLRTFMTAEGRARRGELAHVAVQIDPEQSQYLDPAGARRFLSKYFQMQDINIYWGTATDLLREIKDRRAGVRG